MYGSHTQILKTSGNIVLSKRVQHSHGFTSRGRGTIKTKITYSVGYSDADLTENYSGVFGMTNKQEALRTFNKIVKYGMSSLVQEVG